MTARSHLWILRWLLFTVAFVMIVSWLPLIRVLFDGVTYQWGTSWFGHMFSSAGLQGDWWVLVVQLAFGTSVLYYGYRGPRKPFYTLLPLWFGLYFVDLAFTFYRDPEGLMFHGDTLDIHFNMGYPLLGIAGFFLALAVYWIWRDKKDHNTYPQSAWTKRNKTMGIAAAALLPPVYFLLSTGVPHATTDEIGVILTMIQWGLINAALYPWGVWKPKS